jgi:hypothetical protein
VRQVKYKIRNAVQKKIKMGRVTEPGLGCPKTKKNFPRMRNLLLKNDDNLAESDSITSISGQRGDRLEIKVINSYITRVTYISSSEIVEPPTFSTVLGCSKGTDGTDGSDDNFTPSQGFDRDQIPHQIPQIPTASNRLKHKVKVAADGRVGVTFTDGETGLMLSEDYSYATDGLSCVHKTNLIRRGFPGSEDRKEYFYGCGDSPGRADRYGQCVRVANSDCMGYDPRPENSGAPAYKQVRRRSKNRPKALYNTHTLTHTTTLKTSVANLYRDCRRVRQARLLRHLLRHRSSWFHRLWHHR